MADDIKPDDENAEITEEVNITEETNIVVEPDSGVIEETTAPSETITAADIPEDDREHVVSAHEEVADKFGIDMKESYKDSGSLKIIPREWYTPIIRQCVNQCSIKPESMNVNEKDRLLLITFDSLEKAENFIDEFNKPMFNCINTYIRDNQDANPQHYNRALVITTEVSGSMIQVSY